MSKYLFREFFKQLKQHNTMFVLPLKKHTHTKISNLFYVTELTNSEDITMPFFSEINKEKKIYAWSKPHKNNFHARVSDKVQ